MLSKKLLYLLVLIHSLLGCSTSPGFLVDIPLGKKVDLNNSDAVKNKLYSQYKNWSGVEYQMGGLDKNASIVPVLFMPHSGHNSASTYPEAQNYNHRRAKR